jgi:hypothetical protein
MNIKMTLLALAIACIAVLSFRPIVKGTRQEKDNILSPAEIKAGWMLMFDGKSTAGWRTYQNKPDDSWEVVNGELHCKKDGVHQRADLVTGENYASFEIKFDWRLSKGANSGLLYHVQENHDGSYETGPEYQLIDDAGYEEKLEDWQKSGSDYGMHPPTKIASRPAGEYNHSRLIVDDAHVQHWLNGVKVADFTAWTPEWESLKKKGKWKDYPDYGIARSGLIALQDHGGGIWFKNIKIKKL